MKLELQDLPNLHTLLKGSHVSGAPSKDLLEYWIANRRPIAGAIRSDGTFLDIGCANGFLLVCLQRWSEYTLTPYGIDTDPEGIAAARDLLPEFKNHFAQVALERFQMPAHFGFPESFDFVFWCVWDGLDFTEPQAQVYAKNAFGAARAGGRVILGFYDTDRALVERQLEWLIHRYGACTQILRLDVVFAWWDCAVRADTTN
jgi:SAM-dependent methyltransferase